MSCTAYCCRLLLPSKTVIHNPAHCHDRQLPGHASHLTDCHYYRDLVQRCLLIDIVDFLDCVCVCVHVCVHARIHMYVCLHCTHTHLLLLLWLQLLHHRCYCVFQTGAWFKVICWWTWKSKGRSKVRGHLTTITEHLHCTISSVWGQQSRGLAWAVNKASSM